MEHLADFKINEFQLYTEHTFAYRNYQPVWQGWGPLTGQEILQLDARCRELGIDLVPNQNSFGHLRYWLEYPPLKSWPKRRSPTKATKAPTCATPLPSRQIIRARSRSWASFTMSCCPISPASISTSAAMKPGTWAAARARNAAKRKATGRVYLDFLKKIHREVSARNRQMMFWGDIVLHHPELIKELPKDVIALNWGYEASHPFEREAGLFAKSKIPFYVCPGTSTWMSLIGRHDNGFANLRLAADAGRKHGALGFLNTDWGDGGHPQPLAVSYLPYLVGAAVSWCAQSFDEKLLVPVLSRDVFQDPTQRMARAALALGLAHRKFKYFAMNVTPFGAVLAAPLPKTRELMCRDGLKYYARIPEKNIRAALDEVEKQRAVLHSSKPAKPAGEILALELDLAARMAVQSCKIMLWQQALAAGKNTLAKKLAAAGIRELRKLDQDFRKFWPARNKGTTQKCSPWLRWRMEDYRRGLLHFPPEVARVIKPKTYAAD